MDFLDIFPFTIKTIKTTVDHVGRTDREMTYVLSTRAMLKQSAFCRKKPNKSKVFAISAEKWMCVSVSAE